MLLSLILNNWKLLAAAAVFAGILFAFNGMKDNACIIAQERAVAAAVAKGAEECEAQKKTTMEAYNALQTKNDALAARVAALKLRRPSRCVAVSTPQPATQHDGTPAGKEPAGRNAGIDSDALIDFSGKAESYRLRLLSCQDFVRGLEKK